MPTEILWTPNDNEEVDLIPAHVTQVKRIGRELRIFFSGRDGTFGDQYEGVLRLRLRLGRQTVAGKQSYKQEDDEWELVPFTVTGQFENRQFQAFSGTWTEGGTSCRIDVLDLPSCAAPAARKRRVKKSSKPRKRKLPR